MPTEEEEGAEYRKGLMDEVLDTLRHDLSTEYGVTDPDIIQTAEDELRARLAKMTRAAYPDPGEFASEVAKTVRSVTAKFAE